MTETHTNRQTGTYAALYIRIYRITSEIIARGLLDVALLVRAFLPVPDLASLAVCEVNTPGGQCVCLQGQDLGGRAGAPAQRLVTAAPGVVKTSPHRASRSEQH